MAQVMFTDIRCVAHWARGLGQGGMKLPVPPPQGFPEQALLPQAWFVVRGFAICEDPACMEMALHPEKYDWQKDGSA